MKPISFPSGLTRRTANCLTKAGIPIEKKAIIKALKNGTLHPHRSPRNYFKTSLQQCPTLVRPLISE